MWQKIQVDFFYFACTQQRMVQVYPSAGAVVTDKHSCVPDTRTEQSQMMSTVERVPVGTMTNACRAQCNKQLV